MEEVIKRLNAEYGFGLSADEIKLVATQAEEVRRMLQPLHEIDLAGIMPWTRVDRRVKQ
ncbi:MAG: hypothetical protein HYY46_10915 [Deltaproteobacteria bacterium]|nr:hypothetical protein [Deltaproteobacteria bacterium]